MKKYIDTKSKYKTIHFNIKYIKIKTVINKLVQLLIKKSNSVVFATIHLIEAYKNYHKIRIQINKSNKREKEMTNNNRNMRQPN